MPASPSQASGGAKNTAYTAQRRLINAKVHQFEVVSNFDKIGGYQNREDITAIEPGLLVIGSKNVLTNTGGRIGVTKGYQRDGQANTTITPVTSSYDWTKTLTNDTHVRSWSQNLDFRYQNPATGEIQWVTVFDDLGLGKNVNYCTFWDPTAQQNSMLFVNGSPYIYRWSGAFASFASATAGTLTISGTQTFEELGFDNPAVYTASMVFTPATTAVGTISVLSSSPVSGGTGYTVGDTLALAGSPGTGATAKVASVNGGVITAVYLVNPGRNYTSNSTVGTPTTGGTGTGAVLNIQQVNTTINPATITDNTAGFLAEGFALGNTITVTGTSSNNGSYQIDNITASTITVSPNFTLNAETASSANIQYLPSIVIDGTRYTYEGGMNTTTLTGVSPNPSAPGYAVGTAIAQAVDQFGNGTAIHLLNSNVNDLIGNLSGQIFIGSNSSATIYTSAVNNFLDYSSSSPRLIGQGAQGTVVGYPLAFVNQDNDLYVSVGKDFWYKTLFTQITDTTTIGATDSGISVAITYETLTYQQLKFTAQQSAQSQACVTNIANDICYLSFEPQVNTFGPVSNIYQSPQITDLSYFIVNDMNAYDFTDASMIYFKKFVYLSVPKEGLIRIYNMTQPKIQYWEAPVEYPIGRFSIIDDELYGHGYSVPETYRLFTGYTFNGHPIPAAAYFSYNNFGVRTYPKDFELFFLEGYITTNCTLTYGFNYDIDGCQTQRTYTLDGGNRALVCIPNDDASLGKDSLGKRPLGGLIPSANLTGLPPKFRAIKQLSKYPFYELQVFFESLGESEQWELLAFGPNASPATEGNNSRQY